MADKSSKKKPQANKHPNPDRPNGKAWKQVRAKHKPRVRTDERKEKDEMVRELRVRRYENNVERRAREAEILAQLEEAREAAAEAKLQAQYKEDLKEATRLKAVEVLTRVPRQRKVRTKTN